MFCWHNGQIVEANELKISPFEHGYLYGIGFFETMRTYEGVPVFFEEHYARLIEALTAYNMTLPYTKNQLLQAIEQLTEMAGGEEGYFRINVAAGDYGLGLQPLTYDNVTVIIFRKDLHVPAAIKPKQAKWLHTHRNTPEQTERFKSHHFGNNVLARQELPNLADYEGLFTTAQGYVAEGVTSNVFWAKDGILYTPKVDLGILPGITRYKVIQLAHLLELPVVEGYFTQRDVEEADELFVTNSIQELVPIEHLGKTAYASDEGLIFRKLLIAYRHEIARKVKGEY